MSFCFLAEQECCSNVKSLCRPSFVYTISRSHLDDNVLSLFADQSYTRVSFSHKFEGEKAVDCGEVARDMYSGFWEKAIKKIFDGSTNLMICTSHSF